MNGTTMGRSQTEASRTARRVGVVALTFVLAAGLAGCMTGRVASGPPTIHQFAAVPAGVDMLQPADRIAEQLDRTAAANAAQGLQHAGRTADRVAEEIARETGAGIQAEAVPAAPTHRYQGRNATHLAEELARGAQGVWQTDDAPAVQWSPGQGAPLDRPVRLMQAR
jgi:hypothetical protein